jgi:hypothetical protein
MSRHLLLGLCFGLLVTVLLFGGCTHDDSVPLPGSASRSIPNNTPLPPGQLSIPFPYREKFSSGMEQWVLERDTAGHLVLVVSWITQEIAKFPVDSVGINQVTGVITLGGKDYNVINLTLNSDNESGWITIQEK